MPENVHLRDVRPEDLPVFYEHQRDPVALRMAAFPSRDRDAFDAHWAKILADDSMGTKTIVADGRVTGYVGSWVQSGERLIGYWIGREFWGGGIATRALALFVAELESRPLYAYVARENLGSIRVLQKCGFTVAGEDADEFHYVLR
ncbi:MAG TPA: GNAT family N-acetyltransferase [Thermoanaerobaculia bacterium]|nr:GNAT family N-acetyltransferase [Thermoanaerobaculia bacterium]